MGMERDGRPLLASAQRGMTQTRGRGASARSGLEGLPLRKKSHEDFMHVFWCSGNRLAIRLFSRPVLEASLGESEAQPPKRDLQAFRIDCRMCVPLEFVGVAASGRRLDNRGDGQLASCKVVSDMRSHSRWKAKR